MKNCMILENEISKAFWKDFGWILEGQNDEKSIKNGVEKYVFFRLRFFSDLLRLLVIFGGFWEARALPKITKKLKKTIFERI